MKSIWRIWDNYNYKMMDSQHNTEEDALKTIDNMITVRKARKEKYDLRAVEAEFLVESEHIYNLRCDLDRLDYFTSQNNNEKIGEYMELIIKHVRDMLTKQ